MKVTIEYQYDENLHHKYSVFCRYNGKTWLNSSSESFEKAKSELLQRLRNHISNTPEIPQPEEIEL